MQRPHINESNRRLATRFFATAGVGVAAKIVGLINQVVSVTLITGALGADGLQKLMLAVSLVGWFHFTLYGMHTSLPVLLIRSRKAPEAFSSIVKSAYLFGAIGATCAFCITLALYELGFVGERSSAPVVIAAACNAVVTLFGLSERVFQAADRIAQFNLLNLVGTLLSLIATYALTRTNGTAAGFVAAYYLGIAFPSIMAALTTITWITATPRMRASTLGTHAKQLFSAGMFGFGWEISAYCKLQAPLVLLGAVNLADDIAPIGLGLRLIALASSGLSVVIPILFLRVGSAAHAGDERARRLWIRVGFAGTAAVALGTAGSFLVFGPEIYRLWTNGIVVLQYSNQLALAAFAALALAQNLLFPLLAPDPALADRVRWLFWIEGPAVLAAGIWAAIAVPANYGAAAMLGGASAVMMVTTATMLISLMRTPLAADLA